jgi:hypothetical protein
VAVDRGPRGSISGAPGGGGLLTLEGPETGGFDVQRFWYGTLRVDPRGSAFEGGFGGSERIQNPCGSHPPIVTCLVTAGWIRAQRVRPASGPALPTPARVTPTATAQQSPSPTHPAPTSSHTAAATRSPTPSATAPPLEGLFFPAAGAG